MKPALVASKKDLKAGEKAKGKPEAAEAKAAAPEQKKRKNKDLKEVKEIIFENFNYIIESWKKFHKGK